MLKKIFKKRYVVAGVVVFLLLFFVGVFALNTSWGESALYSAVLTVVGMVVVWWQWEGL